ncbi:MAG TPA: nuclease-related domain-containing protein [Propionicimonas sp.]
MGAAPERWSAMRNRRRAGARARRRFQQQRKTWLRRHRRAWWGIYGAAVVVWVMFWALMRLFPGNQSWATAAMAGGLIATIIVMRQSPPVAIANWQAGAYGEEETAKALRPLERDGWVVLHDLVNGTGNFDHVVLGRNGVFCLNSKWSSYRLEETDAGRLIGRHEYDEDLTLDVEHTLRRARAEAGALSRQIQNRCGQKLWVQPVIVWWGPVANGGKLLDGVGVVQGKHLAERLRAQRGRPVPNYDVVLATLRPGRHRR